VDTQSAKNPLGLRYSNASGLSSNYLIYSLLIMKNKPLKDEIAQTIQLVELKLERIKRQLDALKRELGVQTHKKTWGRKTNGK
jgi:hypothetical protein